jgi:hypothetical protein
VLLVLAIAPLTLLLLPLLPSRARVRREEEIAAVRAELFAIIVRSEFLLCSVSHTASDKCAKLLKLLPPAVVAILYRH